MQYFLLIVVNDTAFVKKISYPSPVMINAYSQCSYRETIGHDTGTGAGGDRGCPDCKLVSRASVNHMYYDTWTSMD